MGRESGVKIIFYLRDFVSSFQFCDKTIRMCRIYGKFFYMEFRYW